MNIVPTVREPDGLAMSSRNMRLSNEERKIAPVIYESLQLVKQNLQPGDLTNLTDEAKHKLTEAGLAPDDFSIAHAETLEQINNWNGKDPLVALVAAFLGEIRLIDNLTLTN
ncbi:MAG TPA: pantoate--beta-alanine ligase, partial [Niabella sp.]|nr:pantoate--beta-alanine ligase [Niabella sp.]